VHPQSTSGKKKGGGIEGSRGGTAPWREGGREEKLWEGKRRRAALLKCLRESGDTF